MIYPQYAITVAHANDFAAPDEFVKIAGGLLLLLGVGTMIGPFLAAQAMEHFIPEGLFAFTACSHILLGLYTLFRMSRRGAPPGPAFRGVSIAKGGATPESVVLDPRSGDSPRRGCGRAVGSRRCRHRSRDRGTRRGAASRRGDRIAGGDDPPAGRAGRATATRLVESETRTEPQLPTPATDDEVAPSAPADGGTETPR